MSAITHQQTAVHLTRRVRHWDRRLRLVTSVIWGPRGVILGLAIGLITAVISRLRPWLLPDQIMVITAIAVSAGLLGLLASIWLWPRAIPRQARYFDHRFGLKERISTALELIGGVIPMPEHLAEHQLSDAVSTANRVNAASRLPLRVRALELLVMFALAILLALMLLARNPYAEEIESRQALQQAINNQATALQETVSEIEQNSALTEEEQQALAEQLAEAMEILQQPNVSQQEAVAALAEAAQEMNDLSDGMMSEQEQAYQAAANSLAGSDATADLAAALEKPDLSQTADELDDLSQELSESEPSEAEQQDLAERLEQAAANLQESNPALAEKLREAAQALREGNTEAASQALREAAEMMREQQEQLENSALAQSAQQAQEQLQQSQQEIAQAGREQSEEQANSDAQQNDGSQQREQTTDQQSAGQETTSQQQTGSQQTAGEQGDAAQSSESEQGDAGEEGQTGEGQPQGAGEPGQNAGQGQEAGQGAATEGEGEGAQSTSGDSTGQSTGQSQAGAGQPGENAQAGSQGGSSGLAAGEGEGGAGTDTTTGTQGESGQGQISTDNNPGEGSLQEYDPANASSTIGGQSDITLDVGGQSTDPGEVPLQEGEFSENPEGEASLSYTSVYGSYQNIVSDALESGRIPLDQRDVIHDYFTSLDR